MKILITGGAGFIGSHLVDYCLDQDHEVIVIDNFETGSRKNLEHIKSRNLKVIDCDIRNYDLLASYFKNVDWVFHLAGLADIVPSIEKPETYHEVNVTGTLNVLRAAAKFNVERFIYAASSSCYGIPKNYPTNENELISPMYPYALTKKMGEDLVLHWGQVYGLQVNSLRLFNVYGTRSRTKGAYGAVFGVFLAQKLAGKPFTVIGDGKQSRDFIYVTDVVSAMYQVCNSKVTGEIYNIGTGIPQSINKLVSLLDGKVAYIPKRPGEPEVTHADISKIKNDINWSPKISFEDGVKKILNNIKLWSDAKLWDEKSIENATREWFKYLK